MKFKDKAGRDKYIASLKRPPAVVPGVTTGVDLASEAVRAAAEAAGWRRLYEQERMEHSETRDRLAALSVPGERDNVRPTTGAGGVTQMIELDDWGPKGAGPVAPAARQERDGLRARVEAACDEMATWGDAGLHAARHVRRAALDADDVDG